MNRWQHKNVPGYGDAGEAIVESPKVQMIVFTGSREVGSQIIQSASMLRPGQRFIKRTVTEMGGKNAIIVDSSADLDHALRDILYSVYGYSGQKCSACSRLIVLADVYDAFIDRLKEGIASLKIAPATDPACEVNPVIDKNARAKIEGYLEEAYKEGNPIQVQEVGSLSEQGHFVPPAAFEVEDPDCRIAQEEIFGPLVAVIKVADFDRALELANHTEYGLTGGVFSRTPSHLSKARIAFQCGNLYFNRGITGSIVGRQPFGGFKMSGVGSKTGGPDYLKQFMVSRTVTDNLMRQGAAPLSAEEA